MFLFTSNWLLAFRSRIQRWLWLGGLGCVSASALPGAESGAMPPPAGEVAAVAERRVVELPPYLLGETAGAPWRYARVDDYEVLSHWPDARTRELIEYRRSVDAELALLLPRKLQVQRPTPVSFVLFTTAMEPAGAAQLAARLKQFAGIPLDTDPADPIEAEEAQAARAALEWEVRPQSGHHLWDGDSLLFFFVLNEEETQRPDLALTPEYLRYLMEARAPALPPWFVEGLLELGASAAKFSPPPFGLGQGTSVTPSGGLTIGPAQWVAEDEAALLPLATLFGGPRSGVNQAAEQRRRRAQAALLIRWALDPTKPEAQTGWPPEGRDLERLEPRYLTAEALWKFVERTALEPVTESLFQECFGQNYAEAETRLRDYLPFARTHAFTLVATPASRPADYALRDATVVEASRLQGDLARLEIDYVKELHPPLTANYRNQMRRITQPGLEAAERDVRLQAIVGLAEAATRNDEAARPYLVEAAAARLPLARIYYELARIKFDEVRPKGDAAQKLPISKVADALATLALGLDHAHPLPETYELIAEIWLRTAGQLTREQLALLDEGIRFFPRRLRLIYATSLLYGFAGLDGRARELLEQGLANCANETEKSRLLKLWEAIHEDWAETGPGTRPPAAQAASRWKGPKLKPEIAPRALAEKEEPVIQLKEFKVSEVFPPINVRFNLSGTNLFNTLDDPIVDARVTYVKSDGLGARLGIQVGDVLLALNGADLKGRTIREVAALVEAARQSGDMIWAIRRGATTLTLRHKGKWEIPLPAVEKPE